MDLAQRGAQAETGFILPGKEIGDEPALRAAVEKVDGRRPLIVEGAGTAEPDLGLGAGPALRDAEELELQRKAPIGVLVSGDQRDDFDRAEDRGRGGLAFEVDVSSYELQMVLHARAEARVGGHADLDGPGFAGLQTEGRIMRRGFEPLTALCLQGNGPGGVARVGQQKLQAIAFSGNSQARLFQDLHEKSGEERHPDHNLSLFHLTGVLHGPDSINDPVLGRGRRRRQVEADQPDGFFAGLHPKGSLLGQKAPSVRELEGGLELPGRGARIDQAKSRRDRAAGLGLDDRFVNGPQKEAARLRLVKSRSARNQAEEEKNGHRPPHPRGELSFSASGGFVHRVRVNWAPKMFWSPLSATIMALYFPEGTELRSIRTRTEVPG